LAIGELKDCYLQWLKFPSPPQRRGARGEVVQGEGVRGRGDLDKIIKMSKILEVSVSMELGLRSL